MTEIRYVLPGRHASVWVKHSVSAIFDSGGAVRHLVAVAEDVTARRLAEQSLRRAYDDLERIVHERTAALKQANDVLNAEIEQRKRIEAALKHDFAERRAAQERSPKANGGSGCSFRASPTTRSSCSIPKAT